MSLFRILTIGGTSLWEEEDTLRLEEDILEPNGFRMIRHQEKEGIHYCQLDSRTDLSEFYDWEELDGSVASSSYFCWRTFYDLEPALSPPSTACLGAFPCASLLRECHSLLTTPLIAHEAIKEPTITS